MANISDQEFGSLLYSVLDPEEGRRRVQVSYDEKTKSYIWSYVVYESTGELTTRGVKVGESVYTADVPVLTPRVIASADSLETLIAAVPSEQVHPKRLWSKWGDSEDVDPGMKEYAETLAQMLLNGVLEASKGTGWVEQGIREGQVLETLTEPSKRSYMPCSYCEGRGYNSHECWECREGVTEQHAGLIANPNDLITDTPGEPYKITSGKTNCTRCHGNLTYQSPCLTCNTTGKIPTIITYTITGKNGVTRIPIDLQQLLTRELLQITTKIYFYPTWFQINLILDQTPLLNALSNYHDLPEWADTTPPPRAPFHIEKHGHIQEAEYLLPGLSRTFRFMKSDDTTSTGTGFSYDTYTEDNERTTTICETPQEAYATAFPHGTEPYMRAWQNSVSASLARVYYLTEGQEREQTLKKAGLETDENSVVTEISCLLVPTRSCNSLIEQIVRLLAVKGYGVDLSYGFVATGEYGPSLCITTGDKLTAEVETSHSWTITLHQGYKKILKTFKKLKTQ